ncbi:NlpC/P60 family protein [Sansalvadorimonas verongulae]|uniref:NlpC/P60 family protein n=1 Tax=Sansalvadorimonas verongulae TaxID=2172824 RepID=UPI0012BB8C28|nr:NlpC/P60 family protein [Sansalvadorimonas verongulae]MTI13113.1 hypothetical protein [Sansalvadorimonas verongulae]
MDWILNYLGKPWVNGEQDCWWLVRSTYRDRLNIELPQIVVDANNIRAVLDTLAHHEHLKDWQEIDQPEDMCLVFFSGGRNRPTHVALYLDVDGGRYLHTYQRAGCVCEPLSAAERNGWTSPRYYRYKGSNNK